MYSLMVPLLERILTVLGYMSVRSASQAEWIRHVRPGIGTEYHDSMSHVHGQFPENIGERQYKLSLRLAATSRAQTLKKQAIARRAPAAAPADMSNMG
jgi:hypothetical protein